MTSEDHERAIETAIRMSGLDGGVHVNERLQVAIKVYLSVTGLFLVPREATPEMISARFNVLGKGGSAEYEALISAAPNPFESKQDE